MVYMLTFVAGICCAAAASSLAEANRLTAYILAAGSVGFIVLAILGALPQ